MKKSNIIPAINPNAQVKIKTHNILMDRVIIKNKSLTEEQNANIKPLFD